MTSPLFPIFKKRVRDTFDDLISNQVTPWVFLNSGKPFRVKRFDGRQISHDGIGYEGSPETVFWSRYIEPFLEDICLTEIRAAVGMAQDRRVDGTLLLPELGDLLSAGCRRTYERMAEIDQRLRGRGHPSNVGARSIERELDVMTQFIDEHINAELTMWVPGPQPRAWFRRLGFWGWLIPTLVAISGVLATVLMPI